MKVPIYILGFLINNGPAHGYKLHIDIVKETGNLSNFKQPTIYYHLDRLHKKGYIALSTSKKDKSADKEVFRVTPKGRSYFSQLLSDALSKTYLPDFTEDSALFFLQHLDKKEAVEMLQKQIKQIDEKVGEILLMSTEMMLEPDKNKTFVGKTLLNHKLYHYQVELKWLRETIKDIENMEQ